MLIEITPRGRALFPRLASEVLLLLQEHAADQSCPCETDGERCVRKYLIAIEAYAQKTMPMEDNQEYKDKLQILAQEAKDYRAQKEKSLCGHPEEAPNVLDWARDRRRELGAYSLACEEKPPKFSDLSANRKSMCRFPAGKDYLFIIHLFLWAVFLEERKIQKILERQLTLEGAGVKLRRVLGNDDDSTLDPFLLLDHFGSDNPQDYILGFPWHPHRGIETVTYMWTGEVEHGDSIGNKGVIRSGDVQWMTAGSGIVHQEMPQKYEGLLQGFQLWVNLPAKKKMIKPKYRGIEKDQIPTVEKRGQKIKVVSGKIGAITGPIQDLSNDIEYFDVELAAGETFEHPTRSDLTVFAYIVDGSVEVGGGKVESGECVVFSEGDSAKLSSRDGARFLFVSGEPLKEPVAWRGPIVMNTWDELEKAFEELNEGTFIKSRNVLP